MSSSVTPKTYDVFPKLNCLEFGNLVKSKVEIECQNEPGINPDDPNKKFGDQTIVFPEGSTIAIIGDQQFMTATKEKPQSVWIRLQLACGDQIGWMTIVCSPRRIYDFETLRGKKSLYREAFLEYFSLLEAGTVK
jgi:hypothetical protein